MAQRRKNRVGRPLGRKYCETIPLRFTEEQARAIAAFAKREGVSQAEAIRRLVERGFDR
jgi:hypothetical protein